MVTALGEALPVVTLVGLGNWITDVMSVGSTVRVANVIVFVPPSKVVTTTVVISVLAGGRMHTRDEKRFGYFLF